MEPNNSVNIQDYGCPTGVVPRRISETPKTAVDPFTVQVSGNHYKAMKIQPIQYIHANSIPFAEGGVIKYVSRWREKDGIKDLEKARHLIDLLIELEQKAAL